MHINIHTESHDWIIVYLYLEPKLILKLQNNKISKNICIFQCVGKIEEYEQWVGREKEFANTK